MDNLALWVPLLLGAGFQLAVSGVFGACSAPSRIMTAVIGLVFAGRYVAWRIGQSLPESQGPAGDAWVAIFLLFELMTVLSSILLLLFMTRTRDRSTEADACTRSPLLDSPVDVFIVTYNEDYDILERTIVGALAIAHADLRVWVLDDGARDWVHDLAIELGAEYRRRLDGRHAKAGNVNNGLREALATGRRPAFILLLDADFVAARRILQRTLPLFEEDDVGIVQTPQHFFNADPIQSNLLCTQTWPDEQRFFFNVLMPCKDAWGAAFCCGTSAVFRTTALEASQGLAIETVTEDMLTTFKMAENGWRTVFLNEPLSFGLAPEGLAQYANQRARWCLGAIQQIYTRWSFAGTARLNLVNRISSFDGFIYWSFVFPYKLIMFSAPALYWWTGVSVIHASLGEMLYWLLPCTAINAIAMVELGRSRAIPVLTDVSQLVIATVITRTVALALVKPFGHPFKVTAKGLSSERTTVQWRLMMPLLVIASLTATGVLLNLSPAGPLSATTGYAVNLVWSVFNILILLVAAVVCVEQPQRRTEERFETHEPGCMVTADGARTACRLVDISVRGARVARGDTGGAPALCGMLELDNGLLAIPFELIREIDGDLALRFPRDVAVRRKLITRLFTGRYSKEIGNVRLGSVLLSITGRLFA